LFSAFLCEDLGFFSAVSCPNIKANRRGTRKIPQRAAEKIEIRALLIFSTDYTDYSDSKETAIQALLTSQHVSFVLYPANF
jgi:hypothetical protein